MNQIPSVYEVETSKDGTTCKPETTINAKIDALKP